MPQQSVFLPYCEYRKEPCARASNVFPAGSCLFFAYPSEPQTSVDAIHRAIDLLADDKTVNVELFDWRDLPIEGNLIFCEICQAIRKSTCVVLNTTYVNFNVLFEYGFSVGTGKAVWPLVEEGIANEDRVYTSITTLTTIGYSSFTHGKSIYNKMLKKKPWLRTSRLVLPTALGQDVTRDTMALMYLQSNSDNEPSFRISETLSILPIEVVNDNPREVAFQPLSWYLDGIKRSYAVLIHLGNRRTEGYVSHWAKCALVAGISLALGRRLLILGEDTPPGPIDYRDIIKSYKNANEAERITQDFTNPIKNQILTFRKYIEADLVGAKPPLDSGNNILSLIELGDYIAENEEQSLVTYFVETPQFLMALEPRFRIFVGRKGSGKTANFFMALDRIEKDKRNLICRIKPKEWQMNELLQFVKSELDAAKKGYLLESLWKSMIYSETLKSCFEKILERPPEALLSSSEEALKSYVEARKEIFELSFTSRLVTTVRTLNKDFSRGVVAEIAVSEILHQHNIGEMHDLLTNYVLENAESCNVVIDGLDANWHLGDDYEIMADILLSLIASARDIWRVCKKGLSRSKDKNLSILIFLRSDVFKVILERAKEPDKLEYELITWEDLDSLIQVIEKRIMACLEDYGIDVLNWADVLEPGFTFDDMRNFIKTNLIFRPRDIVYLFQRVLYHARSRGSERITKRDFSSAMRAYSEYAFQSISAESQPYIPSMKDLILAFGDSPAVMTLSDVEKKLQEGGVKEESFNKTLDFLVESNFLGYGIDDFNYRFPTTPTEALIMLKRAGRHLQQADKPKMFKIHNAFHEALVIQ